MKTFLQRFFSSSAYAVVGVSENREKYGNIVYRYLREKNFIVYPVNPNLTTVEDDKCYPNVAALPGNVKSVVLVIPPEVTEQAVLECKAKGIAAVWMQPGAESLEAIAYANTNGIAVISDACIMVMLSPVKNFGELKQWLAGLGTSYSI